MLYPSLCVFLSLSLSLFLSLSRSLSLPISLRVLFLCLCLCVSLSLSVPLSPLPLFLSLQVLQLRYGNSVRRRILIHSSEFESFLFFFAILDTQGPLILFVGPRQISDGALVNTKYPGCPLPWIIISFSSCLSLSFIISSSSLSYIPVAVVGLEELLKRIKCQDQECKLHDMRLKVRR